MVVTEFKAMNEYLIRKRAFSPLFFGSLFLVLCALFLKSESGVALAAEKKSKPWQAKPGKTSGWLKAFARGNEIEARLMIPVCFLNLCRSLSIHGMVLRKRRAADLVRKLDAGEPA